MGQIILVPVAHVSRKSVQRVKNIIEEEKPDAVAVELCPSRLYALLCERKVNIKELLRRGAFFALILSLLQKRIAKKFGVVPGEEMLTAVREARRLGIPLLLIDRDIFVTMRRLSKVGLLEKLGLFLHFTRVSADDLSDQKYIDSLVNQLKIESPGVYRVLVHERDEYMAERLRTANYDKIVAVIGAGHLRGMQSFLFSNKIDDA